MDDTVPLRCRVRHSVVLAFSLLPSAVKAQITLPKPYQSAAPLASQDSRFDLAQLTPTATTATRDTSAGGDAELRPGIVGGIEAGDRQRGATAVLDSIAPLFQRQADVSGRLGLQVGARGLLFGRLGYSEFDIGQAFAGSGSRTLSTGGVLVGAGAETRLSPTLSLKTEYHSVNYRSNLSDRQLLSGISFHY